MRTKLTWAVILTVMFVCIATGCHTAGRWDQCQSPEPGRPSAVSPPVRAGVDRAPLGPSPVTEVARRSAQDTDAPPRRQRAGWIRGMSALQGSMDQFHDSMDVAMQQAVSRLESRVQILTGSPMVERTDRPDAADEPLDPELQARIERLAQARR